MKNYFNTIKKCPLFADIEENDLQALLSCLNAKVKKVKKNEIILDSGDKAEFVGIVLSGSVHIVQEDYWGNRSILSVITTGGLFAEAFSCTKEQKLLVSVISHKDNDILLLDCKKIITTCSSNCVFHAQLIKNLLKVLADKNIMLTRKIEHITKKSTKQKVLSYLSECALKNNENIFEIPFNRQELADYLSVERSALSNTLCKMRDEGIIEFNKNNFRLL